MSHARTLFLLSALLPALLAPGCGGYDADVEIDEGDVVDEAADAVTATASVTTTATTVPIGSTPGTFSVDSRGGASYTIPIVVPPGAAGVEPKLSIDYSSWGDSGPLGMHFALSGLGSVTRCAQTLAQDGRTGGVNGNSDDRFCLDGQRLIAVSGDDGGDGTTYKTEVDSYQRVRSFGVCGTGPCRFEVTDNHGNQRIFGGTADARLMLAGGTVGSWGLSRMTSPNGAYYTVSYLADSGQIYPQQILYTLHDALPSLHQRRVHFTYEARSDWNTRYLAGTRIDTKLRLSTITTSVGVPYSASTARQYRLSYAVSPATSRSLLQGLSECDAAGVCLPATTFQWQAEAAGDFAVVMPTNDPWYQAELRHDPGAVLIPGDYNGDGRMDFIRQEHNGWGNDESNNFNVYFSRGDGTFQVVTPPGHIYQTWLTANYGARIIPGDYNGDGKTDFIRQEQNGWANDESNNFNVYLSNGDGTFQFITPPGVVYQTWLSANYGARIIPGDYDGDGKTDFIRQEINGWANDTANNFEVYFSNGDGTFEVVRPFRNGYEILRPDGVPQQWVPFQGVTPDPNAEIYQAWLSGTFGANIIPGDYNGDGKTDFIRQEINGWSNDAANNFNVYLSNGDGTFNVTTPTGWGYQFELRSGDGAHIIPGDYNGDGKTDFLRQEHGAWENDGNNTFNVYFSRGDGNFDIVTPQGWAYQNDLKHNAGAFLIPLDYNGDGKMDFLRQEHGGWDDDDNNTFNVYISLGDGTFRIITPLTPLDVDYKIALKNDPGAFIIPGDFDGDGKSDFLRQEHGDWDEDWGNNSNSFDVYFGRGSAAPAEPRPVDQMTLVTTGLGATVAIHYAPILSGAPTSGPGKRAELSGIFVVDQYTQGDGRGGSAVRNVTYGVPSMDVNGRGFLGFDTITETLLSTQAKTTRTYNPAFPYTGLLTSQKVASASGGAYEKQTYTYAHGTTYSWELPVYNVRKTSERSEIAAPGGVVTTGKDYLQYDAYGNAILVRDLGHVSSQYDEFDVCIQFVQDTSSITNWRLDYPAERTVGSWCQWTGYDCICDGKVEHTKFQYGNGARMSLLSVSRWESGNSWQTTSFTYDALGNPVTRTEPNGTVLTLGYDSAYQTYPVTETRSGGGLSLGSSFAFDPRFGTRVGATDPAGGTRTVTVDGLGREVAVRSTSPTGALALLLDVTWAKDAAGKAYQRKRKYNDWQGTSYQVTDEYIDGLGRVYKEVTSDTQGSPTPVVDRTFDMEGRVTYESLPGYPSYTKAGTVTTYDDFGHAKSVDGPGGKRTYARSVDFGAILISTTDGLGATSFQWLDARGRVKKQRDADGRETWFHYDALGRRTHVADLLATQTITYDGVGRTVSTTSPDRGNLTATYTPGTGQLAQTVDSDGSIISYTYDGLGRVMQKRVHSKQTVDYTYDQTAYAYGPGRLTSVTITPSGQTAPSQRYAFSYTADGRMASRAITLDGATYTVSRTYDPAGRVTSQTYPDGKVLNEVYDGLGRLSTLTMDGVRHLLQADYLATGQPRTQVYGNQRTTRYWYDERQRLLAMDSVYLFSYGYTWDDDNRIQRINDVRAPAHSQTFSYSAAGYLVRAESAGLYGVAEYQYDAASNLVYKEGSFLSYMGHRVVSHDGQPIGYSSTGDRTSQVKNGGTTSYGYDGEHHLTSVTTNGVVVNRFEYDFEGLRVVKIDADGTKTHYVTPDFEVMFRPDGSRHETKYITAPAGRVASITNSVPPGQTALFEMRGQGSMGSLYDKGSAAGLLGYAQNRVSLWAMDPNARTAAALTLTLALVFALARLARRPLAQKHLGRPLARLRRILLPEATPWARRHPIFALAVPVVLASMLGACGGQPAEPTESTDSTEDALTAGSNGAGNPVSGTYYFHHNHLGSSSLVTNAAGQEVARAHYKPYGELIDAASPGTDMFRAKFTGKEWDKDSGLYYSNARYYDPTLGRFLTADTYLFGGPETHAASLNPYAYAGNNPVIYVDPSGHSFLDFLEDIGDAIVGAITGGMAVNGTWDITKWNWKSWKTWVGIVAGAASGLLGAAMPKNFGGMLAGSIIKNSTNEGLKFLSDEGSSGEEFGINVGLGVGLDVAFGMTGENAGGGGIPSPGPGFARAAWSHLNGGSDGGGSDPKAGQAPQHSAAGAATFELSWSRGSGIGAAPYDPVAQLRDTMRSGFLYTGLRGAGGIAESWRSSATSFLVEPGSSVMLQLPKAR
ncbi:FG-GAP-like repeat-containing protein [Polyangium sp. y55x31]|uniref:FG-GAP-like repeat-containing protein n=1 Tax=Polyangium sp. y55x31 TaxID=3042688 RepID=UPI0024828961|nr:FG-GAP-like repeat-containing protein [Polyangium sp. y55x31]MDI1476385.1 FG-GAP-like repeat-containing protein [Polyangium sp. y55x31]